MPFVYIREVGRANIIARLAAHAVNANALAHTAQKLAKQARKCGQLSVASRLTGDANYWFARKDLLILSLLKKGAASVEVSCPGMPGHVSGFATAFIPGQNRQGMRRLHIKATQQFMAFRVAA